MVGVNITFYNYISSNLTVNPLEFLFWSPSYERNDAYFEFQSCLILLDTHFTPNLISRMFYYFKIIAQFYILCPGPQNP